MNLGRIRMTPWAPTLWSAKARDTTAETKLQSQRMSVEVLKRQ